MQIKQWLSICNECNKDNYNKKRVMYDGEQMKEDRRQEKERRHNVWRQKRQCMWDSKALMYVLSIP